MLRSGAFWVGVGSGFAVAYAWRMYAANKAANS